MDTQERIANIIAEELNIKLVQVVRTIELINEGNTIPFIARYRKEVTVNTTIGKHKIMFDLWSGNGAEEIEITKEHPNVKVTFKLKMGVVTTKPQIIKIENI